VAVCRQDDEDPEQRVKLGLGARLTDIAKIYGSSTHGYFQFIKLLIAVNACLVVPGMCSSVRTCVNVRGWRYNAF
jgi:hypothetical protein